LGELVQEAKQPAEDESADVLEGAGEQDLIKMKKKRVQIRRRVVDGSRMVLHPARKILAKIEFLSLVTMVYNTPFHVHWIYLSIKQ
jgi:hypothetical protein